MWTSSSLFLSNFRTFAAVKDRRYKGENEVAQSVASVRVSRRLRRSGRHLFSTLGHPKALRHYLICRRGTLACKAGAYSHLCRWSGHAFEYGLYAVRRAGDELLEGLRCPRSGGRRKRDRHG